MNRYLIYFTLLLSTGYYAETSTTVFAECKSDLSNFCSNLDRNIKKIQCLLENESKISDKCQSSLNLYLADLKKRGSSVCKDDIQTHCRWVIPGGGRIIKCLLSKESELSPPCKNNLNDF